MNKYIDCSKVYIAPSILGGLGVFSKKDIKKGEIIENGLMYKLKNVDGEENPHLFSWSDDKKVWAGGSGCLPWYNHSDNPNMQKVGDLKKDTIQCIALKDIPKDEEICNKYISKNWRKCFTHF